MATVQLSELGAVADRVRNGETIEVVDGEKFVGKLAADRNTIEERLEELIAQGKARRGTGTLPEDFFTRPRPRFESGSVLEALLEERRSGR